MNGLIPDFFAAHSFKNQEELLAVIIKNDSLDLWTKLRLLALALSPGEPDSSRKTAKDREPDRLKETARAIYKEVVHSRGKDNLFKKLVIAPHRRLLDELGLANPVQPDFTHLPEGSAFLSFTFTLKKPYISRDDAPFHILDNPVRKEKVFKVPMAAASSWKGNLRWMANFLTVAQWRKTPQQDWPEERFRLWRLFGQEDAAMDRYFNETLAVVFQPDLEDKPGISQEQKQKLKEERKEKGVEWGKKFGDYLISRGLKQGADQGLAGSLHFYPTYFDAIDLEVINPHDRKSGAGKNPIYIESVPRGAQGNFSLLYVPLDLMGEDCKAMAGEAKKDLVPVVEALTHLLLDYGFSAKKSSGFGVIEEELGEGVFTIKGVAGPGDPKGFKFTKLEKLTDHLKHLGGES